MKLFIKETVKAWLLKRLAPEFSAEMAIELAIEPKEAITNKMISAVSTAIAKAAAIELSEEDAGKLLELYSTHPIDVQALGEFLGDLGPRLYLPLRQEFNHAFWDLRRDKMFLAEEDYHEVEEVQRQLVYNWTLQINNHFTNLLNTYQSMALAPKTIH